VTEQATSSAATTATASYEGRYISANGVEIYFVEAGAGEPLLLLHGGLISTAVPVGYVPHMQTFAQHFRVIAPDTRGHGRTLSPQPGSISYGQLADDVLALIDALGLKRPLIAGFSDGGHTATIVGIRAPDAVRAIVNDAGFDLFDPQSPSMALARQIFGGSPDATQADPDVVEQVFGSSDEMRPLLELIKQAHDPAQGPDYWKTVVAQTFDRITTSPGYTVEDLRRITAPTLILVGDRDFACSPEQAVAVYRMLQAGELAILPNVGHDAPPEKMQATIDFFQRHV
jgi:pimeloyl-ACP methyl ester carboxylesterase